MCARAAIPASAPPQEPELKYIAGLVIRERLINVFGFADVSV